MSRRMSVISVGLLAVWIVAIAAMPAGAHLHERVGDIEFTVGWADEPAFAGEPNAVQVFVNEVPTGAEEEGPPVDARLVKLTVEIMFGDKASTVKMPAVPLEAFPFGSPGEFRTETVVPTRSGTYTFHFTGTIKGKAFDKFYTSGSKGAIEGTEYSDVREVASVSFPEKDQTNNQLEEAVVNAQRVAARQVQDAKDDAKNAQLFGIIGIGIGVLGLLVAMLRRGKKATS